MPEIDGVQCTKIIKENYPNVKIIVLTTFDDDEYVFNALKYGASGYLLKDVSMQKLAEAIRTAGGNNKSGYCNKGRQAFFKDGPVQLYYSYGQGKT